MIGGTILHYKILEKLGEGGMGIVYKAEDIKLRREVAIKFLPHSISINEEEKRRFEIEAQAAAGLNHPNIATIYSIDEVDDEIFIVMEYVDGTELKEKIRSGSVTVNDSINIANQIVEGLRAAHEKGVIHRDIKSSNIIITGDCKVKIMDFGLAKVEGGIEITKIGTMMGTLAYISPEQLSGEDIDHRTDIWSFGVVLYELLTGQLPFRGDYEQAVMYAIVNEKHVSASSLRPDISDALSGIIDRCLEKEPAARYNNAGLIIDELKSLVQNSVVTKVIKKSVISIAVLSFKDISLEQDNKYFSDGLTEEIIAKLSKIKQVKIISQTSALNYVRAGKSMKQIASDLGVQYVVEGSVRKSGTDLRITTQLIDANQDAYLWADNFNGTINDIFNIQEDVGARIVKALKMNLSPVEKLNLNRRATQNTEAYQNYLKGRFFWAKRTMEGLETAIKYFEKAIEIDENYALAWAGIADAYYLLPECGPVTRKELYPKAIAVVYKALEFDNMLSEAHASLASWKMLVEFDWKSSLKEFKLAIKLNPNYATAHHWYSEWLLFNGQFKESLIEISKAVELDPLAAAILKDKGMALYYSRNYDSAIEFANKSIELYPNYASSYRLLSLAYHGKGMFDKAVIENKKWNELTGDKIESSAALALFYASSGKSAEALNLLEDLTINKDLSGSTCRGIALAFTALGEKDLAFAWLDKAFERKGESLCTTKIDPKLDPLRNDPRFKLLLKRIGL